VICASAGNHAQGVALSAQKLGCRAVIVMPTTTPQIKVEAVKKRGGEVVLPAIPTMRPTPTRWNWKRSREADLRPSLSTIRT
jgi:cysteine synthase